MSDTGKIELFGVKELDDFFETMSRADQRKIIMDSYRAAAAPLVSGSRTAIRTKTKRRSKNQNLYKSIGFVPGRGKSKSVFVTAKIGARRFGAYKGYHGHLFDAGTTQRATKKGFNRGAMPASRFFTDTLAATESQVSNISQSTLIASLEKLIERKLKAQAKKAAAP